MNKLNMKRYYIEDLSGETREVSKMEYYMNVIPCYLLFILTVLVAIGIMLTTI